MKEYEPPKSLDNMTKEEKLVFGSRLIEAREQLRIIRDNLSETPQTHDLNVYDVFVVCNSDGDFAKVREESLVAADTEGYDNEMREAGLNRCRRFRALICELVDERLTEIASKLDVI